ncbi:MAG: coat protein [Circoviridae sp.]|nr:MAG: coat protein [Circoviridae sp.]
MAYPRSYKRSYNKRSYNKKQPWYRKKYDAMDIATKAAKGVWYLKGLVNSEMLHNQSTGNTTTSSTGTVTLLNGMAQNDTSSGRTGNSILMRNIFLRLGFQQHPSATSTTYRVMLVLDTQQVGDTSPAISDILETVNVYAPLATANTGRFKIMKNWFFNTNNASNTFKQLNLYKDVRFHTRYNGPANTDITKNGLYLVALSDQATNLPTFAYTWKVGYHDN